MPVQGFGKVWQEHADVRQRVGCPADSEFALTEAASQQFQGGFMFWRGDTRTIYIFTGGPSDTIGVWHEYPDTWQDGDPMPSPTVTPPPGLYAPVRGFGKLWYGDESIRLALGWATTPETATTGAWQDFQRGHALWTTDRVIRFMYEDGLWERFADTYVAPVAPGSTPRPVENN
jgi:hypothetical protein